MFNNKIILLALLIFCFIFQHFHRQRHITSSQISITMLNDFLFHHYRITFNDYWSNRHRLSRAKWGLNRVSGYRMARHLYPILTFKMCLGPNLWVGAAVCESISGNLWSWYLVLTRVSRVDTKLSQPWTTRAHGSRNLWIKLYFYKQHNVFWIIYVKMKLNCSIFSHFSLSNDT